MTEDFRSPRQLRRLFQSPILAPAGCEEPRGPRPESSTYAASRHCFPVAFPFPFPFASGPFVIGAILLVGAILLLGAILLGGAILPAELLLAEEAPGISGKVDFDVAQGEVRIPCAFARATRILEVFACHTSGPTHETVLAFEATGPAIYRALVAVGCRPSTFWNATSPEDFQRNQGDRLIAIVRWNTKEGITERAAEELLTDGDTGFPMLVRGFSFGARAAFHVEAPGRGPVPEDEEPEEPIEPADADPAAIQKAKERAETAKKNAADARATGVPVGVEISLGALLRQTQPHTLLSHPTASRALQPWVLPPSLDLRVVSGHQELAENETPATLILRRVKKETELVSFARAAAERRGLREAGPVYDKLAGIAAEIDGLKTKYVELVQALHAALDAAQKNSESPDAKAVGERVKGELLRGQWLCARIEERYLAMYSLEEGFKADWIEAQKDIPPETKDEAVMLVRAGFRFEPLLAEKRVELAALDLPDAKLPDGEKALRRRLISRQMEALELERGVELLRSSVTALTAKVASSKDDPYVQRLWQEDLLQARNEARKTAAQLGLARCDVRELDATIQGAWGAQREVVEKERASFRQELEKTGLRDKLLEVLRDSRWNEGDLESNDPQRKADATKKIEQLRAARKELEASLRKLGEAVD
jgi:hypothetical protein